MSNSTQLARSIVAHYITTVLEEKARDILLRYHEDWWYGWVPAPKDTVTTGQHYDPNYRGHWMGERHLTDARAKVRSAQEALHEARLLQAVTHESNTELVAQASAQVTRAEQLVARAEHRYQRTEQRVTQAIEQRRTLRIRQLVTSLFTRYYRTARTAYWPVFDPALPTDIRTWVLRWKDEPSLSPSSLVFLWLVVEETLDHHRTYSLDALGGSDYLARIPLITAHIHTDATLDEPSRAERDYVRWMQRRTPDLAHENGDRRDSRADLTYDGPARDDTLDELRCPTCQGYRRERLIQLKNTPPRFAKALACDDYAHKCRYEVRSPAFSSVEELQAHLAIESFLLL